MTFIDAITKASSMVESISMVESGSREYRN